MTELLKSYSPLKITTVSRKDYGSEVMHDTPYARKNYYENRGRGKEGTAKGGLRGRLWFERMKTDHLPGILRLHLTKTATFAIKCTFTP